jgi:alpha-galactosidase
MPNKATGLWLKLILVGIGSCSGLDNGFKKPALGWSSWYAAPAGSQVTEAFVKASAIAMIDSGLAKKGYTYVNVDEGWLKGRYPDNNTIFEDTTKFPSGMAALGTWVRSQATHPGSADRMKYGLYSCRGTCQCGTHDYKAVGSHGFEAQDTAWMVAAGAQWLKIDSCCGSQNHATAFGDYAKFRDAMNASSKQVWFNLCGWNSWYAPPDAALNYSGGGSLGNSWRIYGDGGSFRAITGTLNTMAKLANFTTAGAYSDPDNILGPHGTVGRVTESQARVQMVMWSIFPTQLILGEDVTKMSPEYIETVGNEGIVVVVVNNGLN